MVAKAWHQSQLLDGGREHEAVYTQTIQTLWAIQHKVMDAANGTTAFPFAGFTPPPSLHFFATAISEVQKLDVVVGSQKKKHNINHPYSSWLFEPRAPCCEVICLLLNDSVTSMQSYFPLFYLSFYFQFDTLVKQKRIQCLILYTMSQTVFVGPHFHPCLRSSNLPMQ